MAGLPQFFVRKVGEISEASDSKRAIKSFYTANGTDHLV